MTTSKHVFHRHTRSDLPVAVRGEGIYLYDSAGKRYNYVAVITDPTVFTRPWTATIPARKYSEEDETISWHYKGYVANHDGEGVLHEGRERICVENNGPFGQVSILTSAAQ